jgi:hypothetical protein
MVQLGGYPDLAEETLPSQYLGQVGLEHLEGNVAVVLEVAREIDDRHASMADLALDCVAAPERGGELVLQLRQTGILQSVCLGYHARGASAREPDYVPSLKRRWVASRRLSARGRVVWLSGA